MGNSRAGLLIGGLAGSAAQFRGKARQITHEVRKQAEKLEQRGQAMFDGQRDNLTTIVEAGKNAAKVTGTRRVGPSFSSCRRQQPCSSPYGW